MVGCCRCAIAVTMLESRPPLRNDATGTSATRWARDGVLEDARQVAAAVPPPPGRPRRRCPSRYRSRRCRRGGTPSRCRPGACAPRARRRPAGAASSRAWRPPCRWGRPRARVRPPSTIAFSSEANRTPSPRGMMNSGLIPNGSRASARLPVVGVVDREGEHARGTDAGHAGPQARQASRTTSVSELVREPRSRGLQLRPELGVVVQLPVVGQREPVLDHGLVGRRRQVDDREAAVSEATATSGAPSPARRRRPDRGGRAARS